MLNFGAFIAFMGVNAAALVHYKYRAKEKVRLPALAPLFGLLVCAFIWLNLGHNAQLLGAIWLAMGLVLYWLRRKKQGSDADPLATFEP
jgi:hypothetical protein